MLLTTLLSVKLIAFTLKQVLSTVKRGKLVSLQEVSGRNRSFSNFVCLKDLLAHPVGNELYGQWEDREEAVAIV